MQSAPNFFPRRLSGLEAHGDYSGHLEFDVDLERLPPALPRARHGQQDSSGGDSNRDARRIRRDRLRRVHGDARSRDNPDRDFLHFGAEVHHQGRDFGSGQRLTNWQESRVARNSAEARIARAKLNFCFQKFNLLNGFLFERIT